MPSKRQFADGRPRLRFIRCLQSPWNGFGWWPLHRYVVKIMRHSRPSSILIIWILFFCSAYCRNPTDGMWYLFDDAHVTRVKETEIVTTAAYILFYQRRSLSSSSGSSEASSSSSSSDHWAFRLPRDPRHRPSAQQSVTSSR
jgi:hypothetical protein